MLCFSSMAWLPPQVDRKRRHVNLTLRTWKGQQEGKPRDPAVGELVAGRVVAASGTVVRIQLGARLHGRVPLTDLHDNWRDNALKGTCLPMLASDARLKCSRHVSGSPCESDHVLVRLCGSGCPVRTRLHSSSSPDWTELYHKARTRSLQGLRWVAVPAPRSWAGTGRARCV